MEDWQLAIEGKTLFPVKGLKMMTLEKVKPLQDFTLWIKASDGRCGYFDVKPYLTGEAFVALKEWSEFMQVSNHGYFIEWPCGADISADTIESKMTATAQSGKTPLSVRVQPE